MMTKILCRNFEKCFPDEEKSLKKDLSALNPREFCNHTVFPRFLPFNLKRLLLVFQPVSVKRRLQTADCRPGIKCRLRVLRIEIYIYRMFVPVKCFNRLNFVHVEFWHPFYQNGHTNDYLRTPKCYNFLCLDSRLLPFSKYEFTNLLIY